MEELPLVVVLLLLLSSLIVPLVLLDRKRRGRRTPPFSLLVVAGSGGHTTEILRLLSCLSESYSPRHYVLADSDKMSEAKIRSFEQKRAETFSESQLCSNSYSGRRNESQNEHLPYKKKNAAPQPTKPREKELKTATYEKSLVLLSLASLFSITPHL